MNVEKSNASNKLRLIPKEISVGLKHYYVIVDTKGLGLAAKAVHVGCKKFVVLDKKNQRLKYVNKIKRYEVVLTKN